MIETNYLAHYGVKGMKWGVRKDRKEAKSTKSRKRKILKTVGIIAGGTAIAAGAYFAARYYSQNADTVIKAGRKIQHMARAKEDLSQPFYASYKRHDNRLYANSAFFGTNWSKQKKLINSKNIKVAGKKVSLETFSEWVNSSKLAQEKISLSAISTKSGLKREYSKFNQNLNLPDIRDKNRNAEYFSVLASKGYDAIRDVNDQKYSHAISPIIIFNKLDSMMTIDVKDLLKEVK